MDDSWIQYLGTQNTVFSFIQQSHKGISCRGISSPPGRFGHYVHFDRFAEGDGPLDAILWLWQSLQALIPGGFGNLGGCFAPVGIVGQQQPHFNLTRL